MGTDNGSNERPRSTRRSRWRAPKDPSDLPARSWLEIFKRVWKQGRADNLTDWAAALTYYGVLSIFPALVALVALLGLIGPSATDPLIENVKTFAPGPARDILVSAIENLQRSSGEAGVLFVVGVVAALWSASSYVGAFSRAANSIYGVQEGRPFWKLRPLHVALTVALLVLLAVSAFAVVATGPLAERLGELLGVGSTVVDIWNIAKWPLLIVFVAAIFAILYWATPNVRQPGFMWLVPGGATACTIWIAASIGFAAYASNFGSYNATYGALGGVIVFLIWLWISNLAILLGAEMNAELERERELKSGDGRAAQKIMVTPREPAS